MIKIDPNNKCHYIGSKYEETEDFDIKDIAKLVRKEIREKVKGGEFPQGKYSVRIDRFPGGQSLDVDITLLDTKSTKKARKTEKDLIKNVESIVNQYNFYAGNAMIDYWFGRFFDKVQVWYE